MPDELPKGWVKTTLGEVCLPVVTTQPKDSPDLEFTYLDIGGIDNERNCIVETKTVKGRNAPGRARQVVRKADILFSTVRTYLRNIACIEQDYPNPVASTGFTVIRAAEGVSSRFLFFQILTEDFLRPLHMLQTGSSYPAVRDSDIFAQPILLPSTAEQERIVDKLNAALSGMQRAETVARRAQEHLKRYREAVLHAAVTGELTREWREKQNRQNTAIETGEALLQRLLAARRARWEETELARLRAIGKEPKNDRWKLRYPAPTFPGIADLPQLPPEWGWTNLSQLKVYSVYGPRFSRNDYAKDGVAVLRTTDIDERGHVSLEMCPKLPLSNEEYEKYKVEVGDLLITRTGSIGTLAIFDDTIKAIPGAYLLHYRLVDHEIVDFVYTFLRSPNGQKQLLEKSAGTGRQNLSAPELESIAIPLPPLVEQAEIIHEVERRLEAADQLAATLEQKLTQASEIRQSLLREAFSGHLVPQDPNDEPASALLERVRLEKARLEAAQLEARSQSRRQKTSTRKAMKKSQLTPETLLAAFEKIERKTDATLLFHEAGCVPDDVIVFYETLRATPAVRMAFEEAVQVSLEQKAALPADTKEPKPKGRFRLVELWLEDFKNLRDYTVRFDSIYGLDVVLGWNGTGKSNLFESLIIIFRDLAKWQERNQWPKQSMSGGYRLSYEIDEQLIQVSWDPRQMRRPKVTRATRLAESKGFGGPEPITRTELPLPHFVFGYYSGPTNRMAEHFYPMNQAHYVRLREATSDDPKILAALLEQRRFFCAETHHAKYVLLAFCYKEDPEISDFLRERLRITGFESALFIIRKPRWGKGSPDDFWGAKGVMRRVLERLKRFAIAPMLVEQTVKDGYHMPKEDHYYFFLPDLSRLQSFADEYDDARTFFLALESLDFSELIYDVKVQVRVSATSAQEVPITFREMSEGEQQLLMVLGLMRFTKSFQSLVLLDEPDTHLNPQWSVDYLKMLTKIMSEGTEESDEQRTSQMLVATHDPLVITSLVKEQIHLLKRDLESQRCYWEQPAENPRGLGFTGILTSEMFGFRSDLDPETLDLLDKQVDLAGKEHLNDAEARELENITDQIENLGFKSASSDPYYRAFIQAIVRRQKARQLLQKPTLTQSDLEALQRETDEILAEMDAEEVRAK